MKSDRIRRQRGEGIVSHLVVLVLVVLACIAAAQALQGKISQAFNRAGTEVDKIKTN